MSTYQVIEAEDRALLEPLLNQRSASDAIITYYALKHPVHKVNLVAALGSGGVPTSFLVSAQTGMDLFRPLVIPFVASSEALNQLLDIALVPDRPFILQMPIEQKAWLDSSFELSNIRTAELLRLDPAVFEPIINVLVLEVNTPDDYSRYEIRSTSGAYAASGVNWVGDEFAEVYIDFDKVDRAKICDFCPLCDEQQTPRAKANSRLSPGRRKRGDLSLSRRDRIPQYRFEVDHGRRH